MAAFVETSAAGHSIPGLAWAHLFPRGGISQTAVHSSSSQPLLCSWLSSKSVLIGAVS